MSIDYDNVPTPCYVCDCDRLLKNVTVLDQVREKTDCRILLALKAFALARVFPLLRRTFAGTAASSLNEAKLGYEEFGGLVHVCAPAYIETQFKELLRYADYIVFNSFYQLDRYRKLVKATHKPIQCGLRINPECSVVTTEKYDPCARFSRLGVVQSQVQEHNLDGLTGLHFHSLCASSADDLKKTIEAVTDKFGYILDRIEWINLGGGHHITTEDYNRPKLCSLLNEFKSKFNVQLYIEPGEAVALNAGVLVTSVLDIVHNEIEIAILDTSATAHMPDVLEMPYQPGVVGASTTAIYPHRYRLTGLTCLAGDIIGDYYFEYPLRIGSKVVFLDMLHYTMVKNTTFNGIDLPHIATWSDDEGLVIVKEFGYEDYKSRLS